MDLNHLDQYILGETAEEFFCVTEEENQKVAVAMIRQADMQLDILSRDLDPPVYDNEECCEVLEELALRSRYSRIRILLHDPQKVSRRGHLVLSLGKRLGNSLFQFRRVADIHRSVPDTFMIVDGIGLMHRPHTDTLAATVNFKDRQQAKQLLQLFEQLWKEGESDPNTRYLII
jgi:hypothetical protein